MADDLLGQDWQPAQQDGRGTSCRGCWPQGGSSRFATSCARRTCTTRRSRPTRRQPIPANLDPRSARPRTLDGTHNDLQFPADGRGRPALRPQLPARADVFPTPPNLLIPNPRVVSRELMTREQFQPATILNLLAAALDPVHGARLVRAQAIRRPSSLEIPTPPGDDFGEPSIRVPRDRARPGARRAPRGRPPTAM